MVFAGNHLELFFFKTVFLNGVPLMLALGTPHAAVTLPAGVSFPLTEKSLFLSPSAPSPVPAVTSSQGLEGLEAMASSLMETALPRGSECGNPSAAGTHKVLGIMKCWGKLVEKELMMASPGVTLVSGKPSCLVKKKH